MSNRFTYEFIRDFISKKGYRLLSETYGGDADKLTMEDDEGYLYYTSYGQIRYNNPAKFFHGNPFTENNIKLWIGINNRPFDLVEGQSFNSDRDDLLFKCYICPEDEIPFISDWSHIIGGAGCAICHSKQLGKYNNLEYKFPEIAKYWNYEKNGNLIPRNFFPKSRDDVWWYCEKCGAEFYQTISNRVAKHVGCKSCNRTNWINSKRTNVMNSGRDITITNPEILKDWDYDNNIYPPNAYTAGANEFVNWKCSICGYRYPAPISRRTGFNKSGCPACSSSKGEKIISDFLLCNLICFKTQKTFPDCKWKNNGALRFDFYIKDMNLIFEYDGIQHFEPIAFGGISMKRAMVNFENQKIKDAIKNEYCQNKGIKLIRIPYWEYENIENIIGENIDI